LNDPNPTKASRRAEEEAAIEAAEAKELREAEEDRTFLWQMGTQIGRHYQWCLLRDSGYGVVDPFSTNNATMANAVGKQEVGRMIYLRSHRLCPEQWALMWEENARNDGRKSEQQ